MDVEPSFSLLSSFWKCPKCGYTNETPEAMKNAILLVQEPAAVNVSIPGYEGRYCLTCYAKWLSDTIPKLVEIPRKAAP